MVAIVMVSSLHVARRPGRLFPSSLMLLPNFTTAEADREPAVRHPRLPQDRGNTGVYVTMADTTPGIRWPVKPAGCARVRSTQRRSVTAPYSNPR